MELASGGDDMQVSILTPLAIIVLALSGCSESRSADGKAQALTDLSKNSDFVSDDTWRSVEKVTCRPAHLDACNGSGCQRKEVAQNPPVMVVWKPKSGDYQRCDADGGNCDSYRPVVSHSGLFTNLVLPQNATIFRMTSDGTYREIANLVDTTLIYSGSCTIDR